MCMAQALRLPEPAERLDPRHEGGFGFGRVGEWGFLMGDLGVAEFVYGRYPVQQVAAPGEAQV